MIRLYVPVNPEKDDTHYDRYRCDRYDSDNKKVIACCRHFNVKKHICNIFSAYDNFYCKQFITRDKKIATLHFLLNEVPMGEDDQIIEISLDPPSKTLCKNCLYWVESKNDLGDHKHFDTIYTCEVFNKGLNYNKTENCPKRCNICKQLEIGNDNL